MPKRSLWSITWRKNPSRTGANMSAETAVTKFVGGVRPPEVCGPSGLRQVDWTPTKWPEDCRPGRIRVPGRDFSSPCQSDYRGESCPRRLPSFGHSALKPRHQEGDYSGRLRVAASSTGAADGSEPVRNITPCSAPMLKPAAMPQPAVSLTRVNLNHSIGVERSWIRPESSAPADHDRRPARAFACFGRDDAAVRPHPPGNGNAARASAVDHSTVLQR